MIVSKDSSAAKSVAYQRRLKRTSSIGPNTTAQKLGDSAAAVMPAMCASETCCAASIWGIAKNARPPYSPNDEFDSPMIQIGGAVRSDFKQVSESFDHATGSVGQRVERVSGQEDVKKLIFRLCAICSRKNFAPGSPLSDYSGSGIQSYRKLNPNKISEINFFTSSRQK